MSTSMTMYLHARRVELYRLALALSLLLAFVLIIIFTMQRTPVASAHMAANGLLSASLSGQQKQHKVNHLQASDEYGKLPLQFEVNGGQTNGEVKFLARGNGYNLFLTMNEAVLALEKPSSRASERKKLASTQEKYSSPDVLRMKLSGANPAPHITGMEELYGHVNYLNGNDPTKWRTGLATYAGVKYQDVYPGIDIIYYGNQRQLEYDFIVAPGSNPNIIKLSIKGAKKLRLDSTGDLLLRTAGGNEIRQHKPVLYQEVDGIRQSIAGGYVVKGKGEVGFRVERYDTTRPLVIDPVLSYSTYLGGSGSDYGYHIATDMAGNAYVVGYTTSPNFPVTSGAAGRAYKSGYNDAFVAKLNASGSALLYSTYLGGSSNDAGYGIWVDSIGSAYITGYTASLDFPTTSDAFQRTSGGGIDVFVAKLNPAGDGLVYSTLIGGGDQDGGSGIAVDSAGNAYVTGDTSSNASGQFFNNFPTTTGAFQTNSSLSGSHSGYAFLLKLSPAGNTLVYSTLLGGGSESGGGIAVDASGNAYATGYTRSQGFPVTPGAFQTAGKSNGYGIPDTPFVTKLNPSGSGLVYSTYLGGNSDGRGIDIAVDSTGSAYTTGYTLASDFPTTPGAFQTKKVGSSYAAYASKLNPSGSGLMYSTYLDGTNADYGSAIAIDQAGNAYVTGSSQSTDFPLTPDAQQRTGDVNGSVFLTQLNPSGGGIYSTYLGGYLGHGITVDSSGNVYIAGYTTTTNLTATPGAFQTVFGGGYRDAFVTKLSGFQSGAPTPTPTPSPAPTSVTNNIQFNTANYFVNEGAGFAAINVVRTGDTSTTATVDYATGDGTAKQRSDYTSASGRLTFAAGEASKTFTVLLIDNAYVDGDRTVNLSLSNPVGASLGDPKTATLTIKDNDVQQATNPIDEIGFFVRQQYLDFLNRDPDTGGFDYWSSLITSCPNGDAQCINSRRVSVSAAFFIEQEFQDTGSFVYRFYKASYAQLPTYAQFIADRSRVVGGSNIEAGKRAFAEIWAQGPQFLAKYPASLAPGDFVDQLIVTVRTATNNKVDLSANRANYLNTLQQSGREGVLRQIVDEASFKAAEYNNAFVLMQYFGYLRRDPDADGYNFWLDVLNNRVQNNYRGMVCAFINSAEYQDRFSSVRTRNDSICGQIGP